MYDEVDAVAERLRLHDALHVGRPAVLARDEHTRRLDNTVRDLHLLDLVIKDFLHELAETFRGGLGLLERLLLVLRLLHLEAFLGGTDELLALVLLELLDSVLINGVDHEDHLVALLLELLNERRVFDRLLRSRPSRSRCRAGSRACARCSRRAT